MWQKLSTTTIINHCVHLFLCERKKLRRLEYQGLRNRSYLRDTAEPKGHLIYLGVLVDVPARLFPTKHLYRDQSYPTYANGAESQDPTDGVTDDVQTGVSDNRSTTKGPDGNCNSASNRHLRTRTQQRTKGVYGQGRQRVIKSDTF